MTIIYFDTNHAIREHDNIISVSGGHIGVHNLGLIESVLNHIQNDTYYATFCDKLTHLVFSVAMNHAFVDGNKRSAIALGAFFLEINNYQSVIGNFIVEMENVVLWVAQRRLSKDFLKEIVQSLLTHGLLSEEIKIKILINLL